jgi:hypothetical protein
MHTLRRAKRVALFLALLLVISAAVPATSMADPVPLGTTASFAVLAGQGVTNSGTSWTGGDAGGSVGSYPLADHTLTGLTITNGTEHFADTVAQIAQTDLVTAYDSAASLTLHGAPTIIATELGGQNLGPGVYHSESGTFEISTDQTLTLTATDPDDVFIFQTDSTLVTFPGSAVVLAGAARYCRVFWKVGSSATLGTNSTFVGHLFALTSITANNGATVQGQLLARNGAVTLESNTITNGACASTRAIHIAKSANPTALPVGGGPVTYTYLVTNTGSGVLGDIHVADDKISLLTYVSGDDGDGLLETGETWRYTATADLTASTVNIASVTASDNIQAVAATDTAAVTVTVGRSTATGDRLPNTATPWYNVLLVGVALTLLGAAGWWTATRKSRA